MSAAEEPRRRRAPGNKPRVATMPGAKPAAFESGVLDTIVRKTYDASVDANAVWMMFEAHRMADGSLRAHVAASSQWRSTLWDGHPEMWSLLQTESERVLADPSAFPPVDSEAEWSPPPSADGVSVRVLPITARLSAEDSPNALPRRDALLQITKRTGGAQPPPPRPAKRVTNSPSMPPAKKVVDVVVTEVVMVTPEEMAEAPGPDADFDEYDETMAWCLLPYIVVVGRA